MYLTGLIHRDRLFEIATRWFAGRLEPGDGRFITEVFIFENLIYGPTVQQILLDVFRSVHRGPLKLRFLQSKDQLRDALVEACPDPSERLAQLFRRYRQMPEEYFPRTPVDMLLATQGEHTLVGISRVKRIRRIAEKASRRVADCLIDVIRNTATTMAAERAREAGLDLSQLYTSEAVMADEFEAAERAVSFGFREGKITFQPMDLRLDDIIGSKLVGTPEQLALIEQAILSHPQASLHEREVHNRDYKATHLLVDVELPSVGKIVDRARAYDWNMASGRGLSPEALARDYPAYVESGARTVRIEVILTELPELIESEFGRSLHEERVLNQRIQTPYSGRIARNASHIIEYMLMLAISPKVEVEQLPVQMWGRYLPDTVNLAIWDLLRPGMSSGLFDAFVQLPHDDEIITAP